MQLQSVKIAGRVVGNEAKADREPDSVGHGKDFGFDSKSSWKLLTVFRLDQAFSQKTEIRLAK